MPHLPLRMTIVEDWRTDIYAEPFRQHFLELGCQVDAFKTGAYFDARSYSRLRAFATRLQEHFRVGPAVARLNAELIAHVEREQPDVVFVVRGEQVHASTVTRLRRLGATIITWQNDDPLSRRHRPYTWRHVRRALPHYDHVFAYRQSNVDQFRAMGCSSVSMLRSFYRREVNHVADASTRPDLASDVTFIGHWEDDGRSDYVDALLDVPVRFRLWGTFWECAANATRIAGRLGTVLPLRGSEYNLALNATKVALVFLSKLNNDTYTRRCFEITAAGAFMLSEYTDDLASFFRPGLEADYFRSPEEMLDKILFYVRHDSKRLAIARAGHARLLASGHEARDRAVSVLETARELLHRRAI